MLRWIVLLTLGIYASGRLALMLAIPPGYVTAIWPPIGLSLAAVLLLGNRVSPGIWLGSFLVNVSVSPNGYRSFSDLILPAFIALGTTLAVLLAERLIVKKLQWPKLYTGEREILWFLFLSGPIPGVFSALWGAFSLLFSGLISFRSFGETFFTWWVGDSIGGMLFTPLLLVLFQKMFHGQGYQVKKLHVILPIFMAALFTIVMFFLSSYREDQKIDKALGDLLSYHSKDLQRDGLMYDQALLNLSQSVRIRKDISPEEFNILTSPYFLTLSGLEGLAWLTREKVDRAIITHFEPQEENHQYLGHVFDSGSVTEALVRCVNRKEIVCTRWVVPWNDDVNKYVLCYPVAHHDDGADLNGVLLAIVDVRQFMHATLRHSMPSIIQGSWLTDMDLGTTVYEDLVDGVPVSLTRQMDLHALGRNWHIHLVMNPSHVDTLRSMDSWIVLVGGFFMVAILGGLLMLISGRSVEVNQLVEDKTKGLLELNIQLKEEVSQRIELEKGMLMAKEEAEKASEAKSSFLARMSHEMRTPLNQIKLPLQLLKEIKGIKAEEAKLCDMADHACSQILGIVEDVLVYTNLSEEKVILNPQPMIVHKFLREESFSWESECVSKGLTWRMAVSDEMLVLLVHQEGLRVILGKLVQNAIKFTEKGEVFLNCVIKAEGADLAKVTFSLSDTGVGIPKEDQERILLAFEQQEFALRREHGGIGLGLTLVHEWVKLMGGEMRIESAVGDGATFMVELNFERVS